MKLFIPVFITFLFLSHFSYGNTESGDIESTVSHRVESAEFQAESREALSAGTVKAQSPLVKKSLSNSYFDFYSETLMRSSVGSYASESRLRWQLPLIQQTNQPERLGFYAGIGLDREWNTHLKGQYIADAQRPHAGLFFQPVYGLRMWAEYHQRYEERVEGQKSLSDPRWGLSIGREFLYRSFKFEVYSESVAVTRIVREPVTTSHLRAFYLLNPEHKWFVDPYAEIYAASSPHSDLGLSRSEARLGAKAGLRGTSWQMALYAYRPWIIQSSASDERNFEVLGVIGGVF